MALTYSTEIQLGSKAPKFKLKGVDGKDYTLEDFAESKVLVVLFICAHCPYVQAIEDRILTLRRSYSPESVQFVGICSNDPTDYPDDSAANLKKRSEQKGYDFPYLVDETQEVAKMYGAVCTPDIYVYNSKRELAYHGRLDDNWKDHTLVKKQELKDAIDALLSGSTPSAEQLPAMGCSIKWKKN